MVAYIKKEILNQTVIKTKKHPNLPKTYYRSNHGCKLEVEMHYAHTRTEQYREFHVHDFTQSHKSKKSCMSSEIGNAHCYLTKTLDKDLDEAHVKTL